MIFESILKEYNITVVKMQVPILTIEGNIGAGKTTLLQKFEHSLSGEVKVTNKVEHEPVKEFQSVYGNNLINPPKHCNKNPTHWQCLYHPKLWTRCSTTKNGNTRNCSTSLQHYCHRLWS